MFTKATLYMKMSKALSGMLKSALWFYEAEGRFGKEGFYY